jgi:polysaccharide export outer membrane protein
MFSVSAVVLLAWSCWLPAQWPTDGARPVSPAQADSAETDVFRSSYVLGPDDEIAIWALGAEEISQKPVRIDPGGYIDLPLLGRMRASGFTTEQLKSELVARLRSYINEPQVSVNIMEFRSQPVSVIGAVKNPGVHQLQGRKTLVEILSLAGGLAPDAGSSVKITRRLERGPVPLPAASRDASGNFSVAEVSLKQLMAAKNPESNIIIRPDDVISVPRAEMVYVMGEVAKPGGYVLNERETMSALQALSLAGGVTRVSGLQRAKILRVVPGTNNREELSVDLKRMLAGKSPDAQLQPEDILLVPNNLAKGATLRAIESAIQIGTGLVIWRR